MEKQIYKYLKKYYIHFNQAKFSRLLNCKTDEETWKLFYELWGEKEHGGLYRIGEPFDPPEVLPYYKNNYQLFA